MSKKNLLTEDMDEDMDFYFPDEFIKKSHYLIFSKIKLSRRAQDIFALFLGRLQNDNYYLHQDFSDKDKYKPADYTFSIPDLCQWLDIDQSAIFHTMKRISSELLSKKIGVITTDKKNEFELFGLFDHAAFKDAHFSIRAGHAIFPMIVDYTTKGSGKVKHKPFRSLKNVHAKRIYEMLSRFNSERQLKPIKLEMLQSMLGLRDESGELTTKSYKNSNLFIKRCLIEPINEIVACDQVNDHLVFLNDEGTGSKGFRVIKTGKKVTGVEFLYRWIEHSPPPHQPLFDQPEEEEEMQTLMNHPMYKAYVEAYAIVMAYPNKGLLSEVHDVALSAIKLGLLNPLPDYPINPIFEIKLKQLKQDKQKH